MAFPNLGPFNNIVEDFKKSLNNIFGIGGSNAPGKLGLAKTLIKDFDPTKWTGNTNREGAKRLRYGFRVVDLTNLSKQFNFTNASKTNLEVFYLDIPPQAISQKEIFSTNVVATRRGIVVESEGVVFKDIVISGTTGVFPGQRDGFGGEQANFKDFRKPPTRAGGVDEEGKSRSSKLVSGYTEFMALRAFFLKYADDKIKSGGAKFLVFINEKDQQALVVEPLEFNMERNSKNPLQYQYRIILKCITTLDAIFTDDVGGSTATNFLTDVVNISRNASAAIKQFRAAVGATNRLVQGISQEIDKTFIQPLRLLGSALDDLAEARKNVLAVPSTLRRNLNEAILSIQENRFTQSPDDIAAGLAVTGVIGATASSLSNASVTNNPVASGKISERGSVDVNTSNNLLDSSKATNFVNSSINELENSAVEPLPKSFVQKLADEAQKLADDIADSINLGNPEYDIIQNRTPTIIANPLRQATSNEFLLLGATMKMIAALNSVLATNDMFQVEAEEAFERDQALLNNIVDISAPSTVRETVIMSGDTLERIALREYGSVLRWVDIAVLNNLKYPYISDVREDGVKIPGDKLLIGNN